MTIELYKNGAFLTEDGQAHTGPGKLIRVILTALVGGSLVAEIHDGTSVAGNTLATVVIEANAAIVAVGLSQSIEIGREFDNGLYVNVTGTGEIYLVFE